MIVTKIVDEDIADKVDIQFIETQLADVENVGIIYVCSRDGGEEDDWIEDGIRYIVIQLPYLEAKLLSDIRPWMLEKAKARLG